MKPGPALLASVVLMVGYAPRLPAQAPGKDEAWKYHEPFQGTPRQGKDFALLGADAGQCVKYEEDGLRVVLPAGKYRQPTGVVTTFGVKGDFDVSVRYEVFQEPEQADAGTPNTGTRVSLTLKLDAGFEASMRRKITPDQPVHILAWQLFLPDGAVKPKNRGANFPVKQKSGRLRMERKGTALSYYQSEGDEMDFKLLTTVPFVADDIKAIQIFGHTSSPKAALDVRFTDLHIEAKAAAPKAAATIVRTFGPTKATAPIEPAPKVEPPPVPAPANPPIAAPMAKTSNVVPMSLLVVLGGVLAILTAIVVGLLIVLMTRSRKDAGG